MQKPKALVICHPFEARICYFLAGLSHFYQLELLYKPNKPFSKPSEVFFLWLFAKDVKFTLWHGPESPFKPGASYDAVFVHAEFFGLFSVKKLVFEDRLQVLGFLGKLRGITKKLFFMELAEFYFFLFPEPEFWQMVDGVVRCYMFKKEYAYLVREEAKNPHALHYHGGPYQGNTALFELNKDFLVEQYYGKIYALPFPGSVVDAPKKITPLNERSHNIGANFRADQTTRVAVASAVVDSAQHGKLTYSMDYDNAYFTNRRTPGNFYFSALVKSWSVERALSKIFYGKYPYVTMPYMFNLNNCRCILALGLKNRSLRNVDCWSHGAVCLDWSYEKMDCGIPMVDGYNYFSLGVREEIFPDNEHFGPGQKEKVLAKVEEILLDHKKQEELVKSQLEVYNQYYSSPANFVKKIFISKAVPELIENN